MNSSPPLDNNMDPRFLLEMVKMKMPFGKYKGWFICNLPESYLVWFHRQGFPTGKLGLQLHTMYEIRLNGLEDLLVPLKKQAFSVEK